MTMPNPIVLEFYHAFLKYRKKPNGNRMYAFILEQPQLAAEALTWGIEFDQFLDASVSYWYEYEERDM